MTQPGPRGESSGLPLTVTPASPSACLLQVKADSTMPDVWSLEVTAFPSGSSRRLPSEATTSVTKVTQPNAMRNTHAVITPMNRKFVALRSGAGRRRRQRRGTPEDRAARRWHIPRPNTSSDVNTARRNRRDTRRTRKDALKRERQGGRHIAGRVQNSADATIHR